MREDGPDGRPTGTPGAGPPSVRARADLRADLRREVVDARLRFEEAGMRAEAHRLLGDDRAATEVVAEQQQVLADLERRLGRVVSVAVLQRDAEEVLAGVPSRVDAPPESPTPAGAARRRVPALPGVASALAVVAVAALAVLGLPDSPSRLDVLGAADPAEEQSTDAAAPSQRPVPPSPDPVPAEVHAVTPSASTADDPATDGPTPADGSASSVAANDAEDPTEDPTEASLDQLVAGIGDALRQLGPDADPDLPGDGNVERASSLEDVVDEVVDELDHEPGTDPASTETPGSVDVDGESGDDGFVSGAGAE